MSLRRPHPDPEAPSIRQAVARAIDESLAYGTILVGDISNTLVTIDPLRQSGLSAVVFYELMGFRPTDPVAFVEQARRELASRATTPDVRTSLAAHAPYSVAPLVFRAIRSAMDRDPFRPISVHLAEGAEEVEFIKTAGGPWRTLLEDLGAWDPAWVAPGVSPVQYLDQAGFLDSRVLAVHGVQMSRKDLDRLAVRKTTLVTCPRSNGHTGAGAPPLEDFYASGVRVAIGTDSLASAPDLSVFAELATLRALAPRVPAARLLDSATREGARALGFESDYGTIEPGKRARLLAVQIPPAESEVEEYLVSGVERGAVRWVGNPPAGAAAVTGPE
jgi:cytosine/adenosine deaminase-related metal-dependent hydrolase